MAAWASMRGRCSGLAAAVLGAACLAAATGSPALAGTDCRTAPYRAGACFWVTGRLTFANGNPAVRLQPRGTRRLLGVVGGDGDGASASLLPPDVERLSRPPSPGTRLDVTGRFEVCPLAPERRGRMRPVCLADATGVAVR